MQLPERMAIPGNQLVAYLKAAGLELELLDTGRGLAALAFAENHLQAMGVTPGRSPSAALVSLLGHLCSDRRLHRREVGIILGLREAMVRRWAMRGVLARDISDRYDPDSVLIFLRQRAGQPTDSKPLPPKQLPEYISPTIWEPILESMPEGIIWPAVSRIV